MDDVSELSQIPPEEALRVIFHSADGDDHLVGFATIRPTQSDEQPALRAFAPVIWSDTASVQRILTQVTTGLFFCRNRFVRSAAYKRSVAFEGDRVWFRATKENVVELRGIVLDVDVGRPEDSDPMKRPSAAAAEFAVTVASRMGRVPEPTLVVRSGRGLHIYYILVGESSNEAPKRTTEAVQTYLHIAEELSRRIMGLGFFVDRGASKRLEGWFKVPGTRDPKTGNVVTAHAFSHPIKYSLDRLTSELLSSLRPGEKTEFLADPREAYAVIAPQGERPTAQRKRRVTAGQSSYPSVVRRQEIERIVYGRSGRMTGCRHMTLFHYAPAVYRSMQPYVGHTEALKVAKLESRKLNQTFTEPLLEHEVDAALSSNYRIPARNETIFADLRVTDDEIRSLHLKSIVSGSVRAQKALRKRYTTRSRNALKNELMRFRAYLIAEGYSYRKVAEATGVAEDTIKKQKAQVFGKRSFEKRVINTSVWEDLEQREDRIDLDEDDLSDEFNR